MRQSFVSLKDGFQSAFAENAGANDSTMEDTDYAERPN
jgi:hypothetical protein